MKRTKRELLDELKQLRSRVAELEQVKTEFRRTQQALRDSDTRFQLFLDNSPSVAFIKDTDGRHLYVNKTFERVFHMTAAEVEGKTPYEMFPESIARPLQEHDAVVLEGGRPLEIIENVPGPDGEPRFWLVLKFPFSDASGQRCVGGVAVDLTESKRTEERLQTLSRMLMEAQESERRNLARELHDEIGQTLTALKLTLEMSQRTVADPAASQHLANAQTLIQDLIEHARGLSLQLRPTMLDDLGLLPALRWFCTRYTDHTGVRVDFAYHGLEQRRFGTDVETAAYRIVQEALTNVARHAGVTEASVRLQADDRVLSIHIEDPGKGFDPSQSSSASCGLAGMRERALLLGGECRIEAAPGKGTILNAVLPLPAR